MGTVSLLLLGSVTVRQKMHAPGSACPREETGMTHSWEKKSWAMALALRMASAFSVDKSWDSLFIGGQRGKSRGTYLSYK